ncbi:MAG TPA: class II aldolase/adducin family protein [Anaerolineales bacterium]|nr:class II aldolase/adducin family protein [Anaerolineales bacterium]HMX18264.1 class II aldolase/adducin family protein [Anaerolineales bacterium]HMX75043.1 class II aldolase/adducin family protein [Anaerolineales bacterium]HMZ41778.1 class II aldolase/adducin family protein [Anaerolineales bacterium]HNB86122.1 class II aldolase/adducin family protein [Anaerolineales bacterium]
MLNFSPTASEAELRLAIIECGRIAYERHLVTSNDGNISARMLDGNILITPSGISKGRLNPDDMLVVDLEGKVISSRPDRKPSSETPMHLEVYKQRPDVRGVLHAHPIYATTLTVSGLQFPVDVLPEVLLTLGDVPITAYATPSSHEDAEVIRPFVKTHNAMLLCQHGSLTYGKHLDEALIHLERIEHVSEIYWRAKMLGEVKRVPPEAQAKLIELHEKYFS